MDDHFGTKSILFLPFIFFSIFSIFFNLSAQIYESSNGKWSVEVKYIEPGTINIYSLPSEESEVVGHFYYLDKILIIYDSGEFVKFGWAKVIYPSSGYVQQKDLLSYKEKKVLDERFKNNEDDFSSTQNWEPHIIECDKELQRGTYDFTIEVYQTNQSDIKAEPDSMQ